jgi:hypothetical protein
MDYQRNARKIVRYVAGAEMICFPRWAWPVLITLCWVALFLSA